MAKELVLQEILDRGARELGRLRGQSVIIGRECPDGITIQSQGVSRIHGRFLQAKNHWFYQDAGSTNGSWLNGTKLTAEHWKLVRPGDSLQIGDAVIRLVDTQLQSGAIAQGGLMTTPQSIVVFANGGVLDEFPVPEFGRALVVGGSGGDLSIEGDLDEAPSLIIEKRGEVICAYRLAKNKAVKINGGDLTESVNIKDGDELVIDKYTLLVNDPGRARIASTSITQHSQSQRSGEWIEGGASQKTVTRIPFGQEHGSASQQRLDETMAIDRTEIDTVRGYDKHPAMRFDDTYGLPPSGSWQGPGAFEDKLVLLMGAMLLLGLIIVVIWWMVH